MKKWLIHALLGGGDPQNPAVRQHCGVLAGCVGIALNILLFGGKLTVGLLTSSVAIVADAVNNLSDAATSVVTLAGFRMAGLEADRKHPFGHGRMEYVAGLVVSMAILLMGLEVGGSAFKALFHPENTGFSLAAALVLCAAIGVKFFLFWFNRTLGQELNSAAMEAAAADSLSDMVSTAVVLLSTLAGHFLHLHVDGLAGLLVAVFILKTGWEAAVDTLDPLLGRPMDPGLAEDVERLAKKYPDIMGVHDLVYHDYGPGRAMLTVHAEVPAELDVLTIHEQIDQLERELKMSRGIETVIHMDPVVRDHETERLRRHAVDFVREVDPDLTLHDFRLIHGQDATSVLFEVSVPYNMPLNREEVCRVLTEKLRELDPTLHPIIQVEHPFVEEADPR